MFISVRESVLLVNFFSYNFEMLYNFLLNYLLSLYNVFVSVVHVYLMSKV